jgi:hypothetical protein
VLTGQSSVDRQGLTRRKLPSHDAISQLAEDLVADGFRVPGGQVEQQGWCITVHKRYIQ